MKNEENNIIYSEPVREIMGQMPRKIIRWGNVAIFIIFLICLVLSWVVRYPDRIPAPVEITTVNPPVVMVSKITGRIADLYVNDKNEVKKDQILAVMETAADISEIRRLRETIDTLSQPEKAAPGSLPEFRGLGEIQEFWSTFIVNLSDYNNYILNDFYGNKIRSLNDEINGIRGYLGKLSIKEKLYSENRTLGSRKYSRDSLLRTNGVYSESDLESSKQALLKINIDLQQVRLDQSEKSIELAERMQLLQDYKIKRVEEKEKYLTLLREAFQNLRARLAIWENTYLLISPVDGVVTFTRFWSRNQTVGRDEPVLTIIPYNPGEYIGRINLKMNRSGKVKKDQVVNIKFSGYPYLEYGMVKGIIRSKSLVTSGDAYILEVYLPNGLITLYGKKLEFTQNMQGTAEIITDDLRLLQKILNPFRYLISRNRSRPAI